MYEKVGIKNWEIETVHVCNRAACLDPYIVFLVIKVYLNGG